MASQLHIGEAIGALGPAICTVEWAGQQELSRLLRGVFTLVVDMITATEGKEISDLARQARDELDDILLLLDRMGTEGYNTRTLYWSVSFMCRSAWRALTRILEATS